MEHTNSYVCPFPAHGGNFCLSENAGFEAERDGGEDFQIPTTTIARSSRIIIMIATTTN